MEITTRILTGIGVGIVLMLIVLFTVPAAQGLVCGIKTGDGAGDAAPLIASAPISVYSATDLL